MDQAVTFHNISTLAPSELNARGAALLADCVRRSAMKWLPDLTHSNGSGDKLRIGVAVWSGYDLRLLDLINDARPTGVVVEVFDLDTAFASGQMEQFLPGLGEVLQVPVAGHWIGGQLVETASGYDARQLVGRVIGFDPQLALQRPAVASH